MRQRECLLNIQRISMFIFSLFMTILAIIILLLHTNRHSYLCKLPKIFKQKNKKTWRALSQSGCDSNPENTNILYLHGKAFLMI